MHPSYSFNVGDWHLISLDSFCFDDDRALTPDCAAETEAWLASDLASNTKRCILAFFHHPYLGDVDYDGAHGRSWPAPGAGR